MMAKSLDIWPLRSLHTADAPQLFESWINSYPVDKCQQNKPRYPPDGDLLNAWIALSTFRTTREWQLHSKEFYLD